MSWLHTVIASLVGLVVGGLGMFAIANLCVDWYRISSFEGNSGYYVIGLTLLGGFGGLLVAGIAARVACVFIGPQWYNQLGVSFASNFILLALILGIAYLGVDRIPQVDGKPVLVVWEVRLPASVEGDSPEGNDPRDWPEEDLKIELVSVVNRNVKGSVVAEIDRTQIRQEQGQWIITGRVPLFTSKGEYCVNIKLAGRDDGFWPEMSTSPQKRFFDWSPWTRTNGGRDKTDDASAVMYRFRYETVGQ